MSTRTWHSGPPPHIGWWNASPIISERAWRWWNGEYWSGMVRDDSTAVDAAKFVELGSNQGIKWIEWTDYYPENARVPRIDPGETS